MNTSETRTATLSVRVSQQTRQAFYKKAAESYPGIKPASVLHSLIQQFINPKGTIK